jgi:hypothetical protein
MAMKAKPQPPSSARRKEDTPKPNAPAADPKRSASAADDTDGEGKK